MTAGITVSYTAARQSAERGGHELMRDESFLRRIAPHLSPEILESSSPFILIN